jgi:hypothetical protein
MLRIVELRVRHGKADLMSATLIGAKPIGMDVAFKFIKVCSVSFINRHAQARRSFKSLLATKAMF